MLSEDQVEKFQKDGYLVVEDFLSDKDVASLRDECHELVEQMDLTEHHTIFSTTKQSYRDDYFLNSGDKIRYFFEDGALDDDGNLTVEKQKSLNKIGHALHVFAPNFKRITFSENVKRVCKEIGFSDPAVCQSMYIFKQPGIGGEVVPHQDASYLHTEPLRVIGVWMALEDATEQNGCLWFIPGSHKEGIFGGYRMVRNPEKNGPACIYIGKKPDYDGVGEWKAVPVKKGSAIVIDGLVLHKSEHNKSDDSRHIYTFHILDQGSAIWSDQNWLQPTEAVPFTKMFS